MADIFLSMVISWYGLPECIINDHVPHFHGYFRDMLLSLLDMKLTFGMASHPQTNGMAEAKNYTIEQLLLIHA